MQLKERLDPFTPRVSRDFRPWQNRDVSVRDLEDTLVIYDPQTLQAHVLSHTAARVWELCNGNRDAGEIVGWLADARGEAPEAVAPQVVETLEQLQQTRLVLGQPNGAGR